MKKLLILILITSMTGFVYADITWDFENGTQGWANFPWGSVVAATITQSNTYAHGGSNSLKLSGSLDSTVRFMVGFNNGHVGRTGDNLYSAYVYTPVGTNTVRGQFYCRNFTYGDSSAGPFTEVIAGTWMGVTATIGAGYAFPARDFAMNFYVYGGSTTYDIYVDDVKVTGSGPDDYQFETGIGPWDNMGWSGNSATITIDNSIKHSGSASLKATGSTDSATGWDLGNGNYSTTMWVITAPSDTAVIFWAYSNDLGSVNHYLKFHGNDGGWGYFQVGGTNYGTQGIWQKFQGDISAVVRPIYKWGINVYNSTGPTFTGSFYFDDVKLTSSNTPVSEWELY